MSSVSIAGDTSGSILLAAPSVAGSSTLTLPTTGGTVLSNTTPGTILQVLQTVKSDTFSANPNPNTWVDVTGLSVSITPRSASNKILVFIDAALGNPSQTTGASVLRLVRNSTAIYTGDAAGSRALGINSFPYISNPEYSLFRYSGVYLDSPATTSATTYKYQVSGEGSGYTVYLNTNGYNGNRWEDIRTASSITVMEVAA